LLGLGTALAPVLVAMFGGLAGGLPVLSALLFAGLPLPSRPCFAPAAPPLGPRAPSPRRFALYAAFAVRYGIYETLSEELVPARHDHSP
jgi:hypothetical protein